MLDITDQLVTARGRGTWPVHEIVTACGNDDAFFGLRAEWDAEADEQWLRLLKTNTLLALVWVPGPFVIETRGHRELAPEITRVTSTYCEVVVVPNMNTPMLSVASNRINDIWPAGEWPTGSVDPAAMTAHDLWYATS
jgi:hypothetical protein